MLAVEEFGILAPSERWNESNEAETKVKYFLLNISVLERSSS